MAAFQAGDHPELSIPTLQRERIPKLALLSAASFSGYSGPAIPSVVDSGDARYISRGCMAIGLALSHARVGSGDEVLLPAYHCISMIEPVVWCGARPLFYRVNEDTSVNLGDIESRITGQTRALLVTHYFGFPQDMVRIRSFCDKQGILLIEDCAHAFFGAIGNAPIGSFGDYAIASPWKFFPVSDGGVLIGRKGLLGGNPRLEARGFRFQAKALVNTLEQAFEYQRMNVFRVLLRGPLLLKDLLLRQARRRTSPGSLDTAPLSTRLGGWGFDPALIRKKMSISSRSIMAMASKQRIAHRRRRNYLRMLSALGDVPGCAPLFRSLPESVVPQVFPLLFDAPEHAFPLLKQAGVPIIRFGEYLWEGMDPSTCPVSAELSRRVFQFPCHQDLTDTELEWMIAEVKAVSRQ